MDWGWGGKSLLKRASAAMSAKAVSHQAIKNLGCSRITHSPRFDMGGLLARGGREGAPSGASTMWSGIVVQ